jgi:hypothetical protein
MSEESVNWVERTVKFPYTAELRVEYRKGKLFRQWYEQYRDGHLLFYEEMFMNAHFPHSGPMNDAFGFHELFVGIKYLEAGYDALWFYRNEACEKKAKELLGGDAAFKKIITNLECGPQPPDLLVFCPETNRFRFVECKDKNEPFTPRQKEFFPEVEDYLSKNRPPCERALADPSREGLFPPLPADQWIHVVRLVPDKTKK